MKNASMLVLSIAAVFGLVAALPAGAAPAKTMDALTAAYNGETSAHARYLKYAEQADKEGLGAVAGLFRAAAKAEDIHLGNFAEVIKEMGGTPKAEAGPIVVKSTKENLQAAIDGETAEAQAIYPAAAKLAKAEGNKDALKAFNYARGAEAEHAKLFKNALADLANQKAKATYYVCPVCGTISKGKPAYDECPVCFTKAEKFIVVT